jgi:hypothetical protein
MPWAWVVLMSVVVGALAGVVGYLAWLLEISNNDWWPWALVWRLASSLLGGIPSNPQQTSRNATPSLGPLQWPSSQSQTSPFRPPKDAIADPNHFPA